MVHGGTCKKALIKLLKAYFDVWIMMPHNTSHFYKVIQHNIILLLKQYHSAPSPTMSSSSYFSRLVSSYSPYQNFFYGLTPFAAILLFKFFLQQIKNNQLVIDNSIDIIKIARKRYEKRRILPRVVESTNEAAEFILKVDQGKHFKHQVAGHTTHVMLKHKDMVLKPLNKHNLFLHEVEFYETMASNESHSAQFPHQFIAKYHGVILGENSCGKITPYLALEDVSRNYKRPCMMDIKMGRQTFEPSASLDKKMREKIKYKYQEQIGFRICGFKVYDSLAQSYHRVGKKFGRSLTPDLVSHGLAAFFYNGMGHLRLDVLEKLVQKLELLLQWLLKQNKWHFYCSSLLITYDAEVLAACEREERGELHFPHRHTLLCCMDAREEQQYQKSRKGTDSAIKQEEEETEGGFDTTQSNAVKDLERPSSSTTTTSFPPSALYSHCRHQDLVDVRMIDHAHTLECSGSNDESYIYSLQSLIRHLELIIGDTRCGGRRFEPSILIAEALSH